MAGSTDDGIVLQQCNVVNFEMALAIITTTAALALERTNIKNGLFSFLLFSKSLHPHPFSLTHSSNHVLEDGRSKK